jgi:hypothetical protein
MTRCRLFALFLSSFSLAAQTAQSPLPNSELKGPAGQTVLFQFQTLPNSVQIYTCKSTNQAFVWTGPNPDAILIDREKTLTVHHYKGPTWEATDGSIVHSDSTLAKHFLPKNQGAVQWLELAAQGPSKQFAKVTFIHRIDTSGGLSPSDKPCDALHGGDQQRVNYSATYLFYVPR